jgi:benzoyl-CoA reductase/2-hydroxyglutaryl-CoA dehydratase subunit BcrC/BadD/HgdB
VKALAQEAQNWPEVPGRRLYLTGSAQETTALYERIEAAGGVVVGEDHDWGDRTFNRDTRTDIDPVRAIVDRYMLRVSNTKRASVALRVADLTENAGKAKAEGVLFMTNMNDDALTWDYPSQKKALGEIGIKSAYFGRLQYPVIKTEGLGDGVRRFVDSLKGGDGK